MRTTPTDAHLARIICEILLDQARRRPGEPILYKELIERAKRAHPNDMVVQSAIPVSLGRRLEVIVQFVTDHQLPPLTCIVVNQSGRPGSSFRPANGSWQADMEAVAQHDWSKWQGQWDTYLGVVQKKTTPRKKRKEQEARQLAYEAHVGGTLPKLSADAKEKLVDLRRAASP